MSEDQVRDIRWILSVLPHRYPMLLVDRVLSIEPGKRIVALKNVSMDEPILQGHFPGHPVVPGVLLVEGMAQAGAILLLHDMTPEERAGTLHYFAAIERARFRRPVVPGDQIRYEIELLRAKLGTYKLEGRAWVDGKVVAEAVCSSTRVGR